MREQTVKIPNQLTRFGPVELPRRSQGQVFCELTRRDESRPASAKMREARFREAESPVCL